MNILVTAGNTWTMIDKVRCITNVFTGRTGTLIALEAFRRGHRVTLVTSNPEILPELAAHAPSDAERWQILQYRTFEELHRILQDRIPGGSEHAIIHVAAVSDYRSEGVYAAAPTTHFDPVTRTWRAEMGPATLLDRSAGKVKSDEDELWIRLVRTPKLIDQFRQPWNFAGVLVKFKLEVDRTESELLEIAERSRRQSHADLMVANTLEDSRAWALVGAAESYEKIQRAKLPAKLLEDVERLARERFHG